MEKPFYYHCSCVESLGEDINAMREKHTAISYKTFLKYCDVKDWARDAGYGRDTGLALGRDWMVAFYKSTFRGVPCYYLVHSAIEHVWLPVSRKKEQDKLTHNSHLWRVDS